MLHTDLAKKAQASLQACNETMYRLVQKTHPVPSPAAMIGGPITFAFRRVNSPLFTCSPLVAALPAAAAPGGILISVVTSLYLHKSLEEAERGNTGGSGEWAGIMRVPAKVCGSIMRVKYAGSNYARDLTRVAVKPV